MSWLCMIAVAGASPGSAGAVHLGAVPVTDQAWAGVGGTVFWRFTDGAGAAGTPHAEVGAAIGRTAFSVQGAVTVPGAEVVPFLASGRYLAVDRDNLHFAVTLQYAGAVVDGPYTSHLMPGFAAEWGRDEKVRYDLAVPLWGLSSYDKYVGPERYWFIPLFFTAGASFRLNDQQRLRLGFPELVSWHLRTERAYVDIGGLPLVVVGGLWAKFGLVF